MDTSVLEKFEEALVGNQLIKIVSEMKTEGMKQVEILGEFEQFRAMLRQQNREDDEDRVMDVMDLIVNGRNPLVQLFPTFLSSEEMNQYFKEKGLL